MKILLTGATGYVGRHLLESWRDKDWEIHAVSRNATAIKSLVGGNIYLHDIDICDTQKMEGLFETIKPNVVVHTAAMSKPNDCELQQEACFAINVTATERLAFLCKQYNGHLLFLSTDFVFGNHGPYIETDGYCPVNYYGRSKQLAEEAIISSNCDHTILRVVFVYGKLLSGQSSTFIQWVQANLADNKTLHIYTDQLRTPCYINDLCWAINKSMKTKTQGVFHICGEEAVTPFVLANTIAEHLNLNTGLVLPTNSADRPEIAKRPENATLQIEKAKSLLAFKPTPLPLALVAIFK